MNVPNILTAIRIMLIPVFAYYLCRGDYNHKENYYVAVFIFLLAGLTDVLDGYIARKFNLITSWGKLADPLADKLMQITALVILSIVKRIIPWELLVIVIAKETLMGIGSILLYKQEKHIVSANWYGKMATVVFYFAILMIIFNEFFNIFSNSINKLFIFTAVLATLFAFFMYTMNFRQIKKTAGANSEANSDQT